MSTYSSWFLGAPKSRFPWNFFGKQKGDWNLNWFGLTKSRIQEILLESTPTRGIKFHPTARYISWTTTLFQHILLTAPSWTFLRRVRGNRSTLQRFNGANGSTGQRGDLLGPLLHDGCFFMQIRVTNNIQIEHGNVIPHYGDTRSCHSFFSYNRIIPIYWKDGQCESQTGKDTAIYNAMHCKFFEHQN